MPEGNPRADLFTLTYQHVLLQPRSLLYKTITTTTTVLLRKASAFHVLSHFVPTATLRGGAPMSSSKEALGTQDAATDHSQQAAPP